LNGKQRGRSGNGSLFLFYHKSSKSAINITQNVFLQQSFQNGPALGSANWPIAPTGVVTSTPTPELEPNVVETIHHPYWLYSLLGLPFALLLGLTISFNRVRGAIVERNKILAQIADRKSQLVTGGRT